MMRQVGFGGALGIVFALCIVAPCLPISLAFQQSMMAQTIQDRRAEGERLFDQALKLYQKGLYQEVLQVAKQSLEIFRSLKDLDREEWLLIMLQGSYESLNLHQEALQYALQSLQASIRSKKTSTEVNSLLSVAKGHYNLGQQQKANEYLQEALKIIRGDKLDDGEKVVNLMLIAVYHSKVGLHQQAIDYCQEGLTISRKSNNEYAKAFEGALLIGIGRTYQLIGQPQGAIEYFQQVDQPQKAFENLQKIQQFRKL
ncbi:MAG: tetratricopeptide repeat protein [Pseudanabaena sp.]|jgi:tetratricopeptide (TPR) repeat protein